LGVTPSLDGYNGGLALALFMLVSPVFGFFFTPLSSLASRKHEYEADGFAAEKASASDLISALVKLYQDNASTLTPDPLYTAFYSSHPPAPLRIANLQRLSQA
jgi:STE24 endopeptidase